MRYEIRKEALDDLRTWGWRGFWVVIALVGLNIVERFVLGTLSPGLTLVSVVLGVGILAYPIKALWDTMKSIDRAQSADGTGSDVASAAVSFEKFLKFYAIFFVIVAALVMVAAVAEFMAWN